MIYMLKSKNTPKFYIGGTKRSLSNRLAQHKYDYNKYSSGTRYYVTSFEVLKHGDVEIIEIDRRINSTTLEKTKLEKMHMEKYWGDENLVNKIMPGRSKKEHYEANKDLIAIKHKKYVEENKDKIKAINRRHYIKRRIEKRLMELQGDPANWPTIL